MVYLGKIENGVVVVEGSPLLPEGTTVRVEPIGLDDVDNLRSMREGLLRVASKVEDLPPDFAENHDHYLHGARRK
ncbi:MAG TPA: hypothetical protein PKI11_13900 [Candidatus Hydrogenedentes bacterium]|nr:hypothetical protein [Candidatus Hydrogenedentota bacterium]HNT89801.1 hypothetical protein [Candidatus Hydrogenedentota bacterium]